MPSRYVSFAFQAEETITDDEILIDDHQHGTRGRKMDRSEIVAGMEAGTFRGAHCFEPTFPSLEVEQDSLLL